MSESRAAAFEKLKIPAAKRRYILEVLEPVLEPMVAEVLGKLPSDPVQFMIEYLQKLQRSHTSGPVVHAAASADAGAASEAEEEEEDNSEDEVEEVQFVKKNKTSRVAVSAEAYGAWNQKKEFLPPVYPKTSEQKDRIKAVLRRSFLFQSLEEKEMTIVIDAMSEVAVGPKTQLIAQGDNGDFLFVVEQGILDIWKKFPSDPEPKLVKVCEAGDTFGELSLLYNVPRAASVESRIECVLWKLDRETFNAIVRDSASKKREKYDEFLKIVPILKSIDAYERSQIADALKVENFKAGATIVNQGETGDKFYILEEGQCFASKATSGSPSVKVMEYKPGDYFGELALLRDEPRAASVVAKTDSRLLVLDRRGFKRLLGPLQTIMENRKYT
jgi:cAMP-dependent protein kinase regulator